MGNGGDNTDIGGAPGNAPASLAVASSVDSFQMRDGLEVVSGIVSWHLQLTCGVMTGMSYVMVDIESDGPIPGDYSMICFGAVIVEPRLDRSFYGRLRPVSERWIPDALKVSGFLFRSVV